jgi:hypothetical protein
LSGVAPNVRRVGQEDRRRIDEETTMIIDCDRCEVRGDACQDCVVGVFLGVPGIGGSSDDEQAAEPPAGGGELRLAEPERRALHLLAEQGLVPRLRLVDAKPRRASPTRRGPGRDTGGFSNAV